MTIDELRTFRNRTPFVPFELRLMDGRVFPIRHPENLAYGRSRIVVGDPEADRIHILSLGQVLECRPA